VLDQTFRHLLESRKKLVLEQVITSIASVADAAQDHFVQFYQRLMPPLKYILQNSNVDELKLLRGKTIECVSLIGLAVGKEVFAADANEIMQILLASGANFESDDPQITYLISAWARICKILGREFSQYLPQVMPAVIKAADFKPEVTMIEGEDHVDDNDDWNFVSLGDQRSLGIRTAGLEDKVTACEMLVCYARELKECFLDWVEPVMKLMLPMLKFLFHDGVRSAAAEAFPCLLACVKSQGPEVLRRMWDIILPAYREAIEKESDLEVLCELLNGLGQSVEELGAEVVSAADLDVIFGILHEQLVHFESRRAERAKASKDEDLDEEELEEMNEIVEIETMVLARISDCVHYSFQAFKEQLMPYFEKLAPQFTALLGDRRPYQDRQWGLCIFDDLIEFGGEASIRYQPIFLEPMIKALNDEYPEVRQAAAYGVGLMGMKGGQAYSAACAQALQPLAAMIGRPNARSTEEDTAATENGISAIAKILKYNAPSVDVNAVIPTFLSWLPVWEDTEEVPYVYDYFCDLVESNHPLVLGENNSNLPRILEIILHAFSHGAFAEKTETTEPVKLRMANIAKMIRANEEVFQTVLRSLNLNTHQQQVLQGILQE
jgi:hypothetical protein